MDNNSLNIDQNLQNLHKIFFRWGVKLIEDTDFKILFRLLNVSFRRSLV